MNEIQPYKQEIQPISELSICKSIPNDHEMIVYSTMAKHAVESKMYSGIGGQAGVMMIMLAARELGVPPMQALNGGLNIINGKVELSARMMSALVRRAGHQIHVKECTDTSCTLVGKRADTRETQTSSYTIQDAQKAGLIKSGGGWVKFPKDMLFARALSRLSRQLFSDVIGIGYVEGEIKSTDCEVLFEEEIKENVEKITPDDNPEESIGSLVDPKEKHLLDEYIDVVKNHFSWTKEKTCIEFLKDPIATMEKFNAWKNKRAH
jgi:hypothetical protein